MTIRGVFLIVATVGALGWFCSPNPRGVLLGQIAFAAGVILTLAFSSGVLTL